MTSKMLSTPPPLPPLPVLVLRLAAVSLLAGCPQSYTLLPEGEAFAEASDGETPERGALPPLPADGFCARRIQYDEHSASVAEVGSIGTVVYDEGGRWVSYGEVSASGAARRLHTRVFDGARLLTYDHDEDADGEPEYSNVAEYDDGTREARFTHTAPDRRSRSVRRWDDAGRLVAYDSDVDGDGTLDVRRRYEWEERVVVVTEWRERGATTGMRFLLGEDGLLDGIERSEEGETISYEHFERDGSRVRRRTLGSDAERAQWVSAFGWHGERLVGETHDDAETEGVDQAVVYSYDTAGRLIGRRSTSPTGSYWAATVSFSYDPEGRLSDVVVRDAEDRETWRTFHITTSCPAGFAHDVPVHPVGEYERWWPAEPRHLVDLADSEWMTSPFGSD